MSALKVVRVEDIERSNTEDFPKSTPRENTTQSTSVNFTDWNINDVQHAIIVKQISCKQFLLVLKLKHV